jgi:hypothetical protein
VGVLAGRSEIGPYLNQGKGVDKRRPYESDAGQPLRGSTNSNTASRWQAVPPSAKAWRTTWW